MNKREIDEITAVRQHFTEFGKYTKIPVGSPMYKKFWQEEHRRCIEGYHIGSDFIPGYFYDYLNYTPIQVAKEIKTSKIITNQQQIRGDREEGFPDYWDGDYDFFHYLEEAENSGQHAMLLGSRGKGKSFKLASMCNRNYFHLKGSKSYCFAALEEYLTKDGIISKAWDIMAFRDNHTPWAKRRQEKDTDMHKRSSIKVTEGGRTVTKGFKSEIIGSTVGDSINKLRGKRGKLIVLEEVGSFRNIHKGWNILRPSMEQGRVTFGLIIAIGTGGDESSNFEGAEMMFNNPKAYKIYPIKNKWEEGKENMDCAYFWPASVNYQGAYNEETGKSDIQLAEKLILEDRKIVKEGNDPHALIRRCAELPLTPTEMMMKISHTHFPIHEIIRQEADIDANPMKYEKADFIGRFELNKETQEFEFVEDNKLVPLRKRFHENKGKPGAVIIYQHPKIIEDMKIGERYIAGIDSYDHDESSTDSFGSCIVLDLFTNSIVAEYTGRPSSEDFYETCRRLLMYYKAEANIEKLNKGIFDYFGRKNCKHYICDEPEIVKEAFHENSPARKRKVAKGTVPSDTLNAYARKKLAEWLKSSTDNPDKPEELVIHKIRSKVILEELRLWNIHGNFDRVSALCMLILLYLEKKKYLEMSIRTSDSTDPFSKFDLDSYFNKTGLLPHDRKSSTDIKLSEW